MLQNSQEHVTEGSVSVYIRLKGQTPKEEPLCTEISPDNKTITITGSYTHEHTFDYVFSPLSSQEELFEVIARRTVERSLQGYNATIFAYGQTGSGKTYTMTGLSDSNLISKQGIIPRSITYTFSCIKRLKASSPDVDFTVKCTFLEVYNEKIYDLLDHTESSLQPRENNGTVFVEGLSEREIKDDISGFQTFIEGNKNRRVGSTCMNRESSRSHSVFTLIIVSKHKSSGLITVKKSLFNLVDLAGSERQSKTKTVGSTLKEAAKINQSLSSLGKVIKTLSEINKSEKQQYINYRDSKLTFILKDSLGGNSFCSIIANINPLKSNFAETISTVQFATRAKNIQNLVKCNEDKSGSITALKEENRRLQNVIKKLTNENKSLKSISNINQNISRLSITNTINKSKNLNADENDKIDVDKMECMKVMYIEKIKESKMKDNELENLKDISKSVQEENRLMKMRLKLRNRTIDSLQALIPDGCNGLSKIDNDLISKGITLRSGDYEETRKIEFNKEYLDRWYTQRKDIQILEKQNEIHKNDVELYMKYEKAKSEKKKYKKAVESKIEYIKLNEQIRQINEEILLENEILKNKHPSIKIDGNKSLNLSKDNKEKLYNILNLVNSNNASLHNVSNLVVEFVNFSTTLTNLQNTINNKNTDVNKISFYKSLNEDYKSKIYNLQSELEIKVEDNSILTEDNKLKEEAIAELTSKLKLQENNSLKQNEVQNSEEFNKLLEELNKIKEENNGLKEDNSLYVETIKNQKKSIVDLKHKLNEVETENKNLMYTNEEQEKEIALIENKYQEQITKLKSEIKTKQNYLIRIQSESESLYEEIEDLNLNIKNEEQKNSSLSKIYHQTTTNSYKKALTLQTSLATLKQSSNSQIKSYKKMLVFHNLTFENIFKSWMSLQKLVTISYNSVQSLSILTDNYTTMFSDLNKVVPLSSNLYYTLNNQYKNLFEKNFNLENRISHQNSELANFKETFEKYKNELQNLAGHKNTAQRIQYHQKIKIENDDLKKRIMILERKLAKYEDWSKVKKEDKEIFEFLKNVCELLNISFEYKNVEDWICEFNKNNISNSNINIVNSSGSDKAGEVLLKNVREKIRDVVKMKEKFKREWRRHRDKVKEYESSSK